MNQQKQPGPGSDLAWNVLGSVEHDPAVQNWLQDIDARGPRHSRHQRTLPWVAAAGVLIAVITGVTAYLHFAPTDYETHRGEQRDVLLSDGSRVTLNTDTLLAVRYSGARRYIELERGEALFSVKHDPTRPFEVAAHGTLTRALGTEFNVDIRRSNVTVSVLEGAVQVAAAEHTDSHSDPIESPWKHGQLAMIAPALTKGEAVEVRSDGGRPVPEKADVQRIDAWRTRRLEFTDTPLAEALEEFNRYSNNRVVIGTPSLRSVRVSGSFKIGDAEGFLFSLREALGVKTLPSDSEIVLLRQAN